jgi:hypothetical protein
MARKWIPACIGVLLVLIAIACVVGGCGKTVEGATANAIQGHNPNCVVQGGKCDKKCAPTDFNCMHICYEKVQDCFQSPSNHSKLGITEEDNNGYAERRSRVK